MNDGKLFLNFKGDLNDTFARGTDGVIVKAGYNKGRLE